MLDRKRLKVREIVFVTAISILAGAASASDMLAPYYEEMGYQNNREKLSMGAVDHIDPFTGGFQLSQVDAVVPGEGGLDIVIRRMYRSLPKPYFHANSEGERTTVGIGWLMHFGRVVSNDETPFCNNSQNDGYARHNSVFQGADGSQHELLPAVSGYGHEMISKSLWVADCTSDGYLVRSTDGTKYFAEHRIENIGGKDFNYVNKIEDLHGNYLLIEYGAAGGGTPDGKVAQPYAIPSEDALNYFDLIKSIKSYDSTGARINTVDFYYKDVNSTSARLVTVKVNGTTYVEYDHSPVDPDEGTLPYFFLDQAKVHNATHDDAILEYGYNRSGDGLYSMTFYETPGNARVEFDYKRHDFRNSTTVRWDTIVVDTRTLKTQGGISEGGVWRYDYDVNSSRDKTTVSFPGGESVVYEHVGADNYDNEEIWNAPPWPSGSALVGCSYSPWSMPCGK